MAANRSTSPQRSCKSPVVGAWIPAHCHSLLLYLINRLIFTEQSRRGQTCDVLSVVKVRVINAATGERKRYQLKGVEQGGGSRRGFPIANEGCSYQIRLTMQNPPARFGALPGAEGRSDDRKRCICASRFACLGWRRWLPGHAWRKGRHLCFACQHLTCLLHFRATLPDDVWGILFIFPTN